VGSTQAGSCRTRGWRNTVGSQPHRATFGSKNPTAGFDVLVDSWRAEWYGFIEFELSNSTHSDMESPPGDKGESRALESGILNRKSPYHANRAHPARKLAIRRQGAVAWSHAGGSALRDRRGFMRARGRPGVAATSKAVRGRGACENEGGRAWLYFSQVVFFNSINVP